MTQKELFFTYLKSNFPNRFEELSVKFELYFNWLVEINQHINLISRKTPIEDYWTLHFLDTLLLTEVTSFKEEMILDFGTGGGLPGVPLAILYPDTNLYLLDARRKKLEVISQACEIIGIENVELVHGRVEEVDFHFANSFDAIVSRSVRISKEFKKSLTSMLKQNGKMYFYKSIQLDDMDQFKKKKITNVSRPELGTRNIITTWK